ncbi:hypothetical protein BB560_002414 [Smittium megazygosporum]|uniref:Acyl-coenzyme A oxidase n=1 Tax=Smittium megazygosporum TaxID=133381 RepID=A0A2T9ZEV0_9FUNG|nr:hypothetical protein BB560_002414 [Smittium megazygosporum]
MENPSLTKPNTANTVELLAKERKGCSFSTQAMDNFINGTEWIKKRNTAIAIIRKNPEVFDLSQVYFMDRQEIIEKAIQIEANVAELLKDKKITQDEAIALFHFLDFGGPYFVHRAMFIPTLERQANEEQKKAFLEPARDYKIIGCYAQTEMGHGSNVRGIETTATFVEEDDTFEIHSPTLTSTKWWIGTLGIAATHACVMAQLIVKGKHYGLYPIIVPVRDLKTFKPFPGVNVGDIGPKMGFNNVDNGFVNFQKVKVSRFNVLQRYINISRTGEVSLLKDFDPRVTYSTMVFVRATIINTVGRELAKSVTIASRYTAVRKQGWTKGTDEVPVLDYDIVQYRLIPLVAKTFAMLGMSHEFYAQYELCINNIESGDFSLLKEMHAVSCGLKKWCSDTMIYGVDTCRHLCGGHGFSSFAGFSFSFNNLYPHIIWEGDNFVLAQQTARYLIKSSIDVSKPLGSKPADPTSLLLNRYTLENTMFSWKYKSVSQIANDMDLLLDLLAYRFSYFTHSLAKKIHIENQSWNDSTVEVQTLSTVYSEYMICMYFKRHINKLSSTDNIYSPIKNLYCITALSSLLRNTGELYSLGSAAGIDQNFISNLEDELMSAIKLSRSQLIPLVDSLGLPDEKLNSSLGRYDGKVYEDYMSRALMEPLNRKDSGTRIRTEQTTNLAANYDSDVSTLQVVKAARFDENIGESLINSTLVNVFNSQT